MISGRKLRVAVLMGGTSSERPISLSTGTMILNALDPERYAVTAIDTQDLLALPGEAPASIAPAEAAVGDGSGLPAAPSPSPGAALAQAMESRERQRPDVVFIALHGKGGEDGTIQGMLELMGLPYTGSGVLASALAMDKSMSKRLFRLEGIPVLDDLVVFRGQPLTDAALTSSVCAVLGGFPVFVKPNAEGSTFGCTLVRRAEQLPEAVATALRYDSKALIERYARGMEITVGVLGNIGDPAGLEALPVIEIVPRSEYYDYESKYAEGGSEHIIPARLPDALRHHAQEIALRCHEILGCRGMSRTDMIACGNQLFVLEVNTIPGMTPTSLLPQAAAHAGIPFSALLDRLIASALPRE